jgi:divalent metal cation (Fe/Co/Zn/Cd) transporter
MLYKEVLGIHDLFIHNYGIGKNYITIHLEVNKNMKLKNINKLCNKIENDFKKENYNIVIHIEPKQ